jgi:hypothetical protein
MRKRRARTSRRWHEANRGYDHERRLSAKLAAVDAGARLPALVRLPDLGRIGWEVVQSEMGIKPTVIIQDLVRLALEGAQTEIRIQTLKIKGEVDRLALRGPQTETDSVGPDG